MAIAAVVAGVGVVAVEPAESLEPHEVTMSTGAAQMAKRFDHTPLNTAGAAETLKVCPELFVVGRSRQSSGARTTTPPPSDLLMPIATASNDGRALESETLIRLLRTPMNEPAPTREPSDRSSQTL